MSKSQLPPDPDDYFADTRMGFGEHIEDLRTHLMRAVKGFFIAVIFGFFVGKQVLSFIAKPVEEQLTAFYDRRLEETLKKLNDDPDIKRINQASAWTKIAIPLDQFRALANGDLDTVNSFPEPPNGTDEAQVKVAHIWMRIDEPVRFVAVLQKAQQLIGKRPALTTLSVQEAFMVYMFVSLTTGFVVGSPWIFYQIWSFIAAGLYPHEKRLVHVYLPFSIGLFLAGVAVCEFLVMPKAVEALLWFNEWIGLEPDMRLSEWLGFAIWLPIIVGLSFQTPLVMMFLNRVGIFGVDSYRSKRRVIWFVMAIFAAVITPSTDPYSMVFLWAPMCLLFELGIYLCLVWNKQPEEEPEESEEEVIEV
jgi:sec-independent protein translocase protein TatC